MLQQQGHVAKRIWFIRSGLVLLSTVCQSGNELSCSLRGPNHVLGIEAAVGAPATSAALTISDAGLCICEVPVFRQWIGDVDVPLGAVMRMLLCELTDTNRDVQRVTGTATRRVARFLLQVSTFGNDGPFQLPHVTVARMLSMRPETLSRALAQLKARGVLANERRIQVLDHMQLRQLAGG